MFPNNIALSVDTGRKKQKEKLRVADTKSSHLLISHINTDVSSVPPSRSSENRSISLTTHLNPAQVDTLRVSVFPSVFMSLAQFVNTTILLNFIVKIFGSVCQ